MDTPPSPPTITSGPGPGDLAADVGGGHSGQPGWGVASAWTAIAAVVIVLVTAGIVQRRAASEEPQGVSFQFELTGKMLVGMSSWLAGYEQMLMGQADPLPPVTALEELARAVLAGELLGPADALDHIAAQVEGETAEAIADALRRLYGDLEAGRGGLPSLDAADRELLENELGWFGSLALHAPGTDDEAGREELLRPLQRIPVVLVIVAVWLTTCTLSGTVILVVMLVLAFTRRLSSGFGPASGAARIYGETFAIWFVGFFALQGLIGLLASPRLVLPLGIMGFAVSLAALAWPVWRGVPWPKVREDIGLTVGSKPLVEPLFGVVTYVVAVPLLLVGAVLFWVIMFVQEMIFPGGGPPGHPAQEALAGGDWSMIVTIFVLGCVAAPIVEETMFRGVLYRHLRDSTRGSGPVVSILCSAVGSSFLFAVIHPQGIAFAPILTGLAVAFCLAREWRGTLVPCIVAHALTNALALSLNVVLFSSL